MRYIGIDLHTTQVTVCYLKTGEDYQFKKYRLDEMEKFLAELAETDVRCGRSDRQHAMVGQSGQRKSSAGGDRQSARI